MLRLVFSLMLSCTIRLRKHELSSLSRMSMISTCNRKEHWKGVQKFVALLYRWQLMINLH
jgi:hypothetical protein